MDWTAGYASDIEYTAGFYREQGPAFLNFACVLNGCEPVDTSQPYTYFELGFGRGLTVNLLAATNPTGQFHAADFNPAHVADARQLAAAAQLANVHLYENSFEELAAGAVDLPQFDFITLHGIYTWVTAENRRHIVDFLRRYLKPGGIVYVSYNAMPGWSASLPLQRMLVEYADLAPNRSDVQIKAASGFIGKLRDTKAGAFTDNAILKGRLESLGTANVNYLVHEYMHKHWQPLYHVDVAHDLASAKLEFVGQAELPFAFPTLFFAPDQLEVVNSVSNASLRETVKDYYLNTMFRKDIFVRGMRKVNPLRRAELLTRFGLGLLVPKDDISLKFAIAGREMTGNADHYVPVIEALAAGPKLLGELVKLPQLAGQSFANLAQIMSLLISDGKAVVYERGLENVENTSAPRMNDALAQLAQSSDEFQALGSPILGTAIPAHFVERLVYLLLRNRGGESDAATLAAQVWAIMKIQGRQMLKDGKPLQTDEENIAELQVQTEKVVRTRIPIWQALKIT